MTEPVIRVENLGKRYRLGQREPYKALRDVLATGAASVVRGLTSRLKNPSLNGSAPSDDPWIWALKEINFEVQQGEVVGIIGRNGAGKSTLLKVLSRITKPTTGRVLIRGRVGSLLEVGTGFHPELTGRENIFLNGAILGMKRADIQRQFDEIVAFAEVEKFLDTPVKHYSSGMYMRLAFAVAAHLEPEILVVDEVLAVGDAQFQRKCLGRMQSIAEKGRTVIFVSHNMTAVQSLCQRGFYLRAGQLVSNGPMNPVVKAYLMSSERARNGVVWTSLDAPGNEDVRLHSIEIAPMPEHTTSIAAGDAFEFRLVFERLARTQYDLDVTFHLIDELGATVFVGTTYTHLTDPMNNPGRYDLRCRVPENLLHDGYYTIGRLLFVKNAGTVVFSINDVLSFEIAVKAHAQFGWMGRKEGVVRPLLYWTLARQ